MVWGKIFTYGIHIITEVLENPVEGFYLEFRGMILAVKGVLHPRNKAIAIPVYVKDDRWKRVRSFQESMRIVRKRLGDCLEWCGFAGRRLPTIPLDKVEKIYNPLDIEGLRIPNAAQSLLSLLTENTGIWRFMGITGSILLGLHSEYSDIDIVIYGIDNGVDVMKVLGRLRRRGVLKPVEGKRWIEETRRDSIIPADTWLRYERMKLLTGIYEGHLYTAKIVPLPHEYWESLEQECKEVGRTRLRGRVHEKSLTFTTPCRYWLETGGELVEVFSMRSRFAEMAEPGMTVEVEGRLEEMTLYGRRWRRIFLGNEPYDYILPVER